jgi:hypothetical protein
MAVVNIVAMFVVLYSPVYLFLFVLVTMPSLVPATSIEVSFNIVFGISLLNSIVNPIFYAFRLRECRMNLIAMFCCCSSKLKNDVQQFKIDNP